jgi:conjugal transfer pilus assembly protein TraV
MRGVPRLPALALAAAVVPGCSFLGLGKGSYSCPGGTEDGARCMSAREVYQGTERSDTAAPAKAPDGDAAAKTPDGRTRLAFRGAGEGADRSPPPAPPFRADSPRAIVPSIRQPIPIRTQAEIMRIWIAPWEDAAGDLHADGYVYTEIRGRAWNLGETFQAPNADFTLSPLGR